MAFGLLSLFFWANLEDFVPVNFTAACPFGDSFSNREKFLFTLTGNFFTFSDLPQLPPTVPANVHDAQA